jgi:hypothetical protein
MQGAPKRQMNAEEMLAELKRAVEASTPAPGAPPPSASTAVKPISAGREKGRSQIDSEGGRPVKSNPEISVGPRPALQKSPSSRSWKLIAGGLALAAAATVGVSFALMNKASNAPERQPSAAATERFVKEVAPVQAGEADAKHPPSAGAQSSAAAFTQTPPGLAATPVPSEVIRPDGTPIAPDRPSPASTDSAPPAQAPKTAAAPAAAQPAKPGTGTIATAPAPASTDSAHQPPSPKTAAPPPAVPQTPARPGEGTVATAPAAASTDSAHSPQTPKTAAAPAAAPTAKPNEGTIATAPPVRLSPDSAHPPQAPKPNATSAASTSNESAEPSAPKLDSGKKSPEKTPLRKPRRSAKASTESVGQAKRRAVEPAHPKEAEKSPEPAPAAGSPAAVAPAAAPSVPQRFANGVTGAFGYLAHLPGALIPHLGGGNGDAH